MNPLRDLRESAGMTTTALAEAAGVHRNTLYAAESGKTRMLPRIAEAVADVLGVDADTFGDAVLPEQSARCTVDGCERPRVSRRMLCDTHIGIKERWPLPVIEPTGDPRWREKAECLGLDPDLFFPEPVGVGGTPPPPPDEVFEACDGCPVRGDCFEFAMRTYQEGTWAGTTSSHRAHMRARLGMRAVARSEPTHGTPAGYRQHARRGERACTDCLRANALAHRERQAS